MEKQEKTLKAYQEAVGVIIPTTAEEVMNMFGLCAVIEMQVINYNLLPEGEKRLIYDMYGEQIICKKPITDSENMMFYLATRTGEMGALFNEIIDDFAFDPVDVHLNMVIRPNKNQQMPNVNRSLHK